MSPAHLSHRIAGIAVLLAVLAMVFAAYVRLAAVAAGGTFMPFCPDEQYYLAEARSTFENVSLHTPCCIRECVSRIGQSGSHGFCYNLLHATIGWIVGFRPANLVWTNVALLAAAVGMLWLLRCFTVVQRLMLTLTVLGFLTVPAYVCSYMQESIHLFLASVAVLLLHCAATRPSRGRWVAAYYAWLALATMFRPHWMIWSAALVPLARSRREFGLYLALFLVAPGISFLTVKLFCAPYPLKGWFFQDAFTVLKCNGVGAFLTALWNQVSLNSGHFFLIEGRDIGWRSTDCRAPGYFTAKHLLFLTSVYLVVAGWRRGQRVAVGAGIVGLLNIALVIVAFDAYYWREHRVLACLIVLLPVAAMAAGMSRAAVVICVVSMLTFPDGWRFGMRDAARSRSVGARFDAGKDMARSFSRVAETVTGDGIVTVLASPAFFRNDDVPALLLPVRSTNGIPIRYTFNPYYPVEFQFWRKLPVHYLMATGALPHAGGTLVYADKYYHLYALADRQPTDSNLLADGVFSQGLHRWRHWYDGVKHSNEIAVCGALPGTVPSSWVRIANPKGVYLGVQQTARVVSGSVYRLAAQARAVGDGRQAPRLFGGRVAFYIPGQRERELVWMTECDAWTGREILFTNTVTGTATIYAHMGYGGGRGTGEFTNIMLKECR